MNAFTLNVIHTGQDIEYKVFTFSGGEVQVRIDPDGKAADFLPFARLRVIGNMTKPEHVVELMLLLGAIKEFGCPHVELTLPYLPYARQDRVCHPGEDFALRTFLGLIASVGNVKTLTVWDVHNPKAIDGIDLPFDVVNVPAESFIHRQMFDAAPFKGRSMPHVVAPDKGAVERAKNVARALDTSLWTAEKVRSADTGAITGMQIMSAPIGDHTSRDLLIVDDICDGGRTFIELAKALRPIIGPFGRIYLYVTHGIFSQGLGVFKGHLDYVIAQNPWPGFESIRPRHGSIISVFDISEVRA